MKLEGKRILAHTSNYLHTVTHCSVLPYADNIICSTYKLNLIFAKFSYSIKKTTLNVLEEKEQITIFNLNFDHNYIQLVGVDGGAAKSNQGLHPQPSLRLDLGNRSTLVRVKGRSHLWLKIIKHIIKHNTSTRALQNWDF